MIAGEFGRMLATSVGIIVIVFFLVRMLPGDVVDVLAIQGDYTYQQAINSFGSNFTLREPRKTFRFTVATTF